MNTIIPIPIWMWIGALLVCGYAGHCIGYIRGINRRQPRISQIRSLPKDSE